jgi:cytochrome c556
MIHAMRILAAAAFACALLATAVRAEQPDNVRVFMRAKLEHAQKALEGLAMEDYDAMAKASQQMSLLSQAASWQVLMTAEYNRQSVEFRRVADTLTEAAKNKNLDGASLAYVELTLKCVQCHRYVRSVRAAAIDRPPALAPLDQLGKVAP